MSEREDKSLARWSHWLAIIANLAVVGGIIFLGIEIRQNSLMMRAQTRNEIAQTILGFLEIERDPGMRDALQRNWQDGVVGDQFYLRSYANTMLRLWENIYYQYQSGLFDQAEFEAEIAGWNRVTQQTFVIDHWNSNRQEYSEGFRAVIDSLIASHQ